jgi:uncharacterized protein
MFERVCYLQALLFNEWKNLKSENRDLPIEWNIMHMYTSAQLAKLLAIKRKIDPEKASLVATLHDIAIVRSGKCERHGERAEPYIRDTIKNYNESIESEFMISKEEEDTFIEAISVHSNKNDFSKNELAELLKDVDCVDRYLNAVETNGVALERCQKALKELECSF